MNKKTPPCFRMGGIFLSALPARQFRSSSGRKDRVFPEENFRCSLVILQRFALRNGNLFLITQECVFD